jgi:chorismate synthase
MAGNSFGHLFRITTFGESHGPALGVVIDGCPAGLEITREEIQKELDRRKPGQNALTTPRDEGDQVEILSGLFEDKTTGTPIALLIRNTSARSQDYEAIKNLYRPGHADFTYEAKYGFRDWRGSGRASARETVARVAAGAVAKKLLSTLGVRLFAYVSQVGQVQGQQVQEDFIEQNPLRCADPSMVDAMIAQVEAAKEDQDSVGGVIEVQALGVPAGWGEPVFHKLSADLAQALMSLPAVKGFEIGDGFAAAALRGSQNNDAWVQKDGRIGTATNHAGGIVGGLSTGEPLLLRLAFKAPSSIAKTQNTVDQNGETAQIQVEGRHDPCVLPRAVPIVEAMTALVLADHALLSRLARL